MLKFGISFFFIQKTFQCHYCYCYWEKGDVRKISMFFLQFLRYSEMTKISSKVNLVFFFFVNIYEVNDDKEFLPSSEASERKEGRILRVSAKTLS